jgi:hypothetical protein
MDEQQSIFEQKRATIMNDFETSGNSNAAQLALLDFLEQLLPTVDEIVLKTPLQGSLDFAILSECKFDNIVGIVLHPGQVTRITNLPRTITRLHVADNLLQDLAELPDSLVDLDAKNNGFRALDLSYLRHLKSVHVSENELRELKLPQSVETVYCENNRLVELDLAGLDHLQTLHCSGNPVLVIRNAASQTQIHMENNPVSEIQRELQLSNVSENQRQLSNVSEKSKETSVIQVDLHVAIEMYMEKKNQYESKLKMILRKNADSMTTSNMKRSERRANLRQLRMLAPCIKCARPVTTVFSNRDRIYRAKCGDPKHPCELDVEIHAGFYQDLGYGLQLVREETEETKQKMIQLKMDSVFNYKTEKQALAQSEEYKKNYELDVWTLENVKQKYEDLQMSEERKDHVAKLQKQIYAIEAQIHQILDAKRTSSVSSIALSEEARLTQDAMDLYVNELMPTHQELQRTVYEWMEMECRGIDEYHLIEKHSKLMKRDDVLEDGKVVRYTW